MTNGSPSVTGTSTAWIANAAEGDGISFDGGSTWYEVSSVTNNTTLTLSTSYAGATASGLTYAIDRRSTRRSMTSELYQVVSNLIQSAVRLYSTTGVPSNSIGSDGSLAFDSTAEKFYQKSAGSWDAGTSIRGYPGAAASVAVGSTTTLPSGSSAAVANSGTSSAAVLEFSIPMGLTGATGATGATGPAAWTTIAAWAATTAYTVGPPASVVTFGSETYVCTTSHTSTASFDPTKFTKVAAKGLDGTGTGDVVGPASSTDLNLAVFSGATGKLIADGGQTIAQVIAAASADAVSTVRNGVAAAFDTLAEVATELGNKITKVTGSSGLLKTAVDGTASVATAGTDYVSPAVAYNMTKGGTFTPNSLGTVSTGTLTPAPADGNYQYYTNNGAHTLAAPASDCEIAVLITNGATAGSVTFSGFTSSTGVGDALTTTNGHRFRIIITRINAVSTYYVKAYQ